MRKLPVFAFTLLILAFTSGCAFSLKFTTGDTEAYKDKSITVDVFQSFATLSPSTLSQSFTEALRDIYIQQSKMNLLESDGDVYVEGSITGYDVRPVAVTSEEVAASNRLTITVKVKVTNAIKPKDNFEQTFSRFADFDASQDLSTVEDELITEITDQLTQDIFNRTLGDW